MKPPRIVYHPAPSPTLDGEVHPARPIDLGSDPHRALAWIRRRLGLADPGERGPVRFEARRLPDAPASTGSLAAPAASVPDAPRRKELSSDELLAALESDPRLGGSPRRD